jgi:hypothetical protein
METRRSIKRKMFHLTQLVVTTAAGLRTDDEMLIRPCQAGSAFRVFLLS